MPTAAQESPKLQEAVRIRPPRPNVLNTRIGEMVSFVLWEHEAQVRFLHPRPVNGDCSIKVVLRIVNPSSVSSNLIGHPKISPSSVNGKPTALYPVTVCSIQTEGTKISVISSAE